MLRDTSKNRSKDKNKNNNEDSELLEEYSCTSTMTYDKSVDKEIAKKQISWGPPIPHILVPKIVMAEPRTTVNRQNTIHRTSTGQQYFFQKTLTK